MRIAPFQSFSCPLDGSALEAQGNSLYCAQGHCFDRDRKGAVNLLPVQFKKTLEPGDSKEMVAHRRLVLESGLYQPVSDFLNGMIDVPHQETLAILDAGCGEGYYTQRLVHDLMQRDAVVTLSAVGLDISKYAIQAASGRSRDIQWLVGTNAHLPLADSSVDIVLCLFGFPVWHEFARVLKPDGVVVCADPGVDHLIELRRVLYPEIKEKIAEKPVPQGFSVPNILRLQRVVAPPLPHVLDAQIMMTPHGFRTSNEQRRQAVDTLYDGMTLDVVFSVYRMQSDDQK